MRFLSHSNEVLIRIYPENLVKIGASKRDWGRVLGGQKKPTFSLKSLRVFDQPMLIPRFNQDLTQPCNYFHPNSHFAKPKIKLGH